MNLFAFLNNYFSFNNDNQIDATSTADVNPANGLPMIDNSIDIQGNPFGTDSDDFYSSFSQQNDCSNFDNHSSSSSFDDFGGFDDHNDFGGFD